MHHIWSQLSLRPLTGSLLPTRQNSLLKQGGFPQYHLFPHPNLSVLPSFLKSLWFTHIWTCCILQAGLLLHFQLPVCFAHFLVWWWPSCPSKNKGLPSLSHSGTSKSLRSSFLREVLQLYCLSDWELLGGSEHVLVLTVCPVSDGRQALHSACWSLPGDEELA